jgi:hypothetical protein
MATKMVVFDLRNTDNIDGALRFLDTALNDGYTIIASHVVATENKSQIVYTLHKPGVIMPEPQEGATDDNRD